MLVTGPTGSGKSTTIYAILQELSQPNVNIVTIEDPVEKVLEGINQVHVNPRAGLTFASGLRSVLRQDPDIIMTVSYTHLDVYKRQEYIIAGRGGENQHFAFFQQNLFQILPYHCNWVGNLLR